MALNLGELSATIAVDNKKALKGIDGTESKLKALQVSASAKLRKMSTTFSSEGDKAGKALGNNIDKGARPGLKRLQAAVQGFGKLAFPVLIAGAAGAAVHLTAALLPAAGAITALPAAAVAAKLAMLTLSMALEGVGDALGASLTGDAKKFEEKLQDLPPTTRGVVKELGGALNGLQKSTQEAFFGPMKGAAKGLAADLKGPLKSGFADIADSLGGVGAEVLKFAKSGENIAFLKGLFKGVGSAIDGVKSGVEPLLAGFRDLIGVFVPGMGAAGQSIGDAMARWGAWMSEISRSGKALGWFSQAKEALSSLWGIGKNVASILSGIFKAGDGGGLLATIEQVTASMAQWVNSSEGQEKLGQIFETLGQIAQSLLTILPGVGAVLMTLAEIFNSLPGPVREGVSGVLAFAIVAKGLSGALGPAIGAIGSIGSAVSSLSGKLKNPESGLRKFGSAAASAASSAGTSMKTAAITVGQSAATMGAATGKAIASFAKLAISSAANAAKVVGGWILMGIQSLLQAARMAIAWVIGLGPIAWIIAAIVAIVALVILYWDEIVSALETAWQWVSDLASDIWGGIVSFFETCWAAILSGIEAAWSFVVGLVQGYIEMVRSIVLGVLNGIVAFFEFCWQSILAGVEFAWSFVVSLIDGYINMVLLIVSTVVNSVVSFLQGAWQWIIDAATAAWNFLSGIVSGAIMAVVNFVSSGIKSVVNWFAEIGLIPKRVAKWFGQMVDGAVTKFKSLIDWARSLPGKVLSALGKIGSKLLAAGKDLIDGLLNGMRDAWGAVKSWILDKLRGLKDAVLDFFGISSPSKMFAYFGEMLGTGLAVGMESTTGLIDRASKAMNASVLAPDADLSFGGRSAPGASSRPMVTVNAPAPETFTATGVFDLGNGIKKSVEMTFQAANRNTKRAAMAGSGAGL